MRRLIVFVFIVLIQLSGAVSQLWAKDLADMTLRELFVVRSTIENLPPAEQEAFRFEWEKRKQSLTEIERKQIEDYEKRSKFPNPYVQGRGYDNQGVNSAIFQEEFKDGPAAHEGAGQ